MSTRLLLMVTLILSLGYLVSTAVPLRCAQVAVNYTELTEYLNITIQANVATAKKNNTNQVTVSNFALFASNRSPDNTTYSFTVCNFQGDPKKCIDEENINSSTTMVFTTSDGMVQLAAIVEADSGEGGEEVVFHQSIIDEGSLSFYDGRIYDNSTKCYGLSYQEPEWAMNKQECCTSFVPITPIVTAMPACTKITLTSTIYNEDDNNSTWASTTFNFDLTATDLIGEGYFYGPSDYLPILRINGLITCDEVVNQTIYCGFPIGSVGSKIVFSMTDNRQLYEIPAGRIITRGGQTLMQEGIPFTPANSCQQTSSPYGAPNHPMVTELCCTQFAPVSTTVSPSSSGFTVPDNALSTSFSMMPISFSSQPISSTQDSSSAEALGVISMGFLGFIGLLLLG